MTNQLINMEIYATRDVFTPTTTAKLTYVDRNKNDLNNDLVDVINTPGKQIVVYGHSGTGKSTLIVNVLSRLYSEWVTTRCTSDMTFEQLILNAFDKLNAYYETSKSKKTNNEKNLAISSEYLLLKSTIGVKKTEENSSTSQRIIPPQLTAQRLAEFMGAANYCWVIEDFHKMKTSEKTKLSQQLKVFVDTAETYKDVKAILIGAVNTAREVVEYDREMDRRVSELYVPLLENDELHSILEKGEKLLNVRFSQQAKNQIVTFSYGLASVTHQIALNMCLSNNITQTQEELFTFTDEHLKDAIKKYINNSSDTYKKRYDMATRVERSRKYDNGRIIIEALSKIDSEEVQQSEILAKIKKNHPDYPPANLSTYLVQLQSDDKGGIIRINPSNGKYSFSDPFMASYIKCLIEIKQQKIADPHMERRKLKEAIEVLTGNILNNFFKPKNDKDFPKT